MTNTTTLSETYDSAAFTDGKTPAYVVRDTGAGMVQGVGDTPEAAWADAVACLDSAGITVVESEPADHNQVAASSLRVLEVIAA